MRDLVCLAAALLLVIPAVPAVAQSAAKSASQPSLFIGGGQASPEDTYAQYRSQLQAKQDAASKQQPNTVYNGTGGSGAASPNIFNMQGILDNATKYGMKQETYSCPTCRQVKPYNMNASGTAAVDPNDRFAKMMQEKDRQEQQSIDQRSADRRQRIEMVQNMLDQDTDYYKQQAAAADAELAKKRKEKQDAQFPGSSSDEEEQTAPQGSDPNVNYVYKKKDSGSTSYVPPKVFISNH